MGVCARAPGPAPRLAAPPSAALGYLDVRVADTDYSSFAVVSIYKELEGALSTMVLLYSEHPDARRPPCPLAPAHLALSAPPGAAPPPRLPPARPLRPAPPPLSPQRAAKKEGVWRDPAALRRGEESARGASGGLAALWPRCRRAEVRLRLRFAVISEGKVGQGLPEVQRLG